MPNMALEIFEPTVTLKGIPISPVPMSRLRLRACAGKSYGRGRQRLGLRAPTWRLLGVKYPGSAFQDWYEKTAGGLAVFLLCKNRDLSRGNSCFTTSHHRYLKGTIAYQHDPLPFLLGSEIYSPYPHAMVRIVFLVYLAAEHMLDLYPDIRFFIYALEKAP